MSIVVCKICGNNFRAKPSHIKLGWGKYCSIRCRSKSQFKGTQVGCATCKKVLYRPPAQLRRSKSGKYFCSKSCQTFWRNSYFIGERHPNWQNGQSAYRRILEQAGLKVRCNLCKIADKRVLSVHHIDHNRQNNKQRNLAWLCYNCHFLVHHDVKAEKNFKSAVRNF